MRIARNESQLGQELRRTEAQKEIEAAWQRITRERAEREYRRERSAAITYWGLVIIGGLLFFVAATGGIQHG